MAQPRHLRWHAKRTGAYFTPRDIVAWVVQDVLREAVGEAIGGWSSHVGSRGLVESLPLLRICDPAMGDGIFLEEAGLWLLAFLSNYLESERGKGGTQDSSIPDLGEWIAANCLYGVDLDLNAVVGARRRIGRSLCPRASADTTRALEAHLVQGDALLDPLIDLIPARRADLQEATQRSLGPERDEFSWVVRFPQVFASEEPDRRGFDVVLGNPPWEVIKVNDREFFDRIMPDFSRLPKDDREEKKTLLLREPEVAAEYDRYTRAVRRSIKALRRSTLLTHQFVGRELHHGAWELNTFRLFIELGFHLTRRGGRCCFVVPSSFMGELSSVGVRRLLLEKAALEWVVAFHPAVRPFGPVDHPFCVFLARKGGPTSRFRSIEGVSSVEELRMRLPKAPFVELQLLDKLAPETMTLIAASDEKELGILRALHRFPALGRNVEGSWNVHPARDLDETRDRHLLTTENTRYKFLKGRAVFPFIIRTDLLTHWVREDLYSKRDAHSQRSRVVWRDIARPNMARRMYATVAPTGYAVGNSLNYLIPEQSEAVKQYLVAVMNSLVFEFRARHISKNSHMNMFVICQVPVPRLDAGDLWFDRIVHDTNTIINNESIPATMREMTQAHIDALVAAAYGLTAREFEFILGTYGRVAKEYRSQVLQEFGKVA